MKKYLFLLVPLMLFSLAGCGLFGTVDPRDGKDGTDGIDGIDGATWWTGSGVPSAALGIDKDMYFNESDRAVYKKSAGAWSLIANLTGLAGSDGATWIVLSRLPGSTDGLIGDFFLNTQTSKVYRKDGETTWTFVSDLVALSTDGSIAIGSVDLPTLPVAPNIELLFNGFPPEADGYPSMSPLEVSFSESGLSDFAWYLDGKKLPVATSTVSLTGLMMGTHNICIVAMVDGMVCSSPIFSFLVAWEGGLE